MAKLIYCTVENIIEARKIANLLLEEKLVACVNVLPSIESIYRWKGKIETNHETILFIKTVDEKIPYAIQRIHELHSYDVPEIIVLPIVDGLNEYFDFVRQETQ
jgi:periplasmic divalent cation tolerance protein